MKRAYVILALTAAVFLQAISCGSFSWRNIVGDQVPFSIKRAARHTPGDAFVGIGTARLSSITLSRAISQTKAREEISRWLQTVARDMITDYMVASETDRQVALEFQKDITVAISESTLAKAVVIYEERDSDGKFWVVAMLTRDEAIAEILSAAESTAKLIPGVNSAMWDTDLMEKALNKHRRAPIVVAE